MKKDTIDILNLIKSDSTPTINNIEMETNHNPEARKVREKNIDIDSFINKFRSEIKKKKKLSQINFLELRKIVKNESELYSFLDIVIQNGLTKNEAIVIGRGIMQSKLESNQKLANYLSQKINLEVDLNKQKNKNNDFSTDDAIFMILQCFLCKGAFIDISNLTCVLKSYISSFCKNSNTNETQNDKIFTCNFLRLLLVIFKKYRRFFDDEFVIFCRKYNHGITKEIMEDIKTNPE